jgi:hypothetical protein
VEGDEEEVAGAVGPAPGAAGVQAATVAASAHAAAAFETCAIARHRRNKTVIGDPNICRGHSRQFSLWKA